MDAEIKIFQKRILEWFYSNGRHFPWRNLSVSNYMIIISEILLQRTKAESVAKFYPIFINKYPSWKQLGKASETELQQTLMPIGLNKQRGTRLFKLAQELNKRKGVFPKTHTELEEIPMMGQYITNAYELFILKRPRPLLDVNMARVLERFFGIKLMSDIRYDKALQKLAMKLVNHHSAKEINWGILDFGATICRKRNPLCSTCIFKRHCKYLNRHT
jgi:A/G-specific adenine glycosylase